MADEIKKEPRKCRFSHHKIFEQELPKCHVHPEEQLVCGPFTHGCLLCNPRKCFICGEFVIVCSC